MSESKEDPEDTPYVHEVLYTNDLTKILSSVVSGLLTVAEPERVRKALQHVLDGWDRHVELHEHMKKVAEQHEAFQKQQREARERERGSGN